MKNHKILSSQHCWDKPFKEDGLWRGFSSHGRWEMLIRIWLENPKKRDRLEDYDRCQDNNEICLEAVEWEKKDWILLAEDND